LSNRTAIILTTIPNGTTSRSPQKSDRTVAFAALRHRDYRRYFFVIMPSQMGDNIKHVISYWLLFQKFHSPVLGGFAVISHWTSFLFFCRLLRRGRLIGLFSMSNKGLKAFSGVIGGLIGIHWSLAVSAIILLAVTVALFALVIPGRVASPMPQRMHRGSAKGRISHNFQG
jgi:hypothetical protein